MIPKYSDFKQNKWHIFFHVPCRSGIQEQLSLVVLPCHLLRVYSHMLALSAVIWRPDRGCKLCSNMAHSHGWQIGAGSWWLALVLLQEASLQIRATGFPQSKGFKRSKHKLQYFLWLILGVLTRYFCRILLITQVSLLPNMRSLHTCKSTRKQG